MQDEIKAVKSGAPKQIIKKDKVIILGCSDSKTLAPLKDDSWDIWGVNNLYLNMPNVPWAGWFEIHDIAFDGVNFLRKDKHDFRGQQVNKYLEQISDLPCQVWMQKKWTSIKNSEVYPKNEIVKQFGNYFTNTISFMIALAIYKKYKTIGIYGVDMAVSSEYHHQRPSCEYFIGLARGMGINVILPDEADLLKARFLYGFERKLENQFAKKMSHSILSMKQRLQQAEMQQAHYGKQVQQYIGGIAAGGEYLKIWETCK